MARGRHESQVVRDVRDILSDVDPARLRHEGLDRTLSQGSDVLEDYVGPGLVVARALLEGEDVDHALVLLDREMRARGFELSRRRVRRLRRRLRSIGADGGPWARLTG